MEFYKDPWGAHGHDAVVIFFVLSGYVIAFSTLGRKNAQMKQYAIARLSRLYSVVIPALLLSALMAVLGFMTNPAAYALVIRPHEGYRYLATGLFMQSNWGWNLVPSDNGPFWSLGYEFWYYVIFGVLVFARNWKWKIGLTLAACLAVGLNILLLMPIWLLGVGLFLYRNRFRVAPAPAKAAFIVTFLVCTVLAIVGFDFPAMPGTLPLLYASGFLTDWILGIGVGVLIWSFDQAWGKIEVAARWENPIRWAANHTFSLYLFHFPLIFFVATLPFFNAFVWWNVVLAVVAILAVIIVLSEFTESKRKLFQKAITLGWDRLGPGHADITAASSSGLPDRK